MPTAHKHEAAAFEHLRKMRDGDTAAARQAIDSMRAAVRARTKQTKGKDMATAPFGRHFIKLRESAGFAERGALIVAMVEKGGWTHGAAIALTRKIEVEGLTPRAETQKRLAAILGIDDFGNAAVPATIDQAPARSRGKRRAGLGGLRGISIEPAEGGFLVRFEAVVPAGSASLVVHLLEAASEAVKT